MSDETYRKLCEAMSKLEGRYPGMDIPEFYGIARELFRPEEAGAAGAMPRRPSTANMIARATVQP